MWRGRGQHGTPDVVQSRRCRLWVETLRVVRADRGRAVARHERRRCYGRRVYGAAPRTNRVSYSRNNLITQYVTNFGGGAG
ncbi:hypothetical protein J6590_052637 [Homalodisca vitripennis]|nr:hypothetical protein J6590_092205 [Homalodisca vitripennis]KAG8310987.1 hypothetical protein J6590_052637 [Homalodisca vitripennis]